MNKIFYWSLIFIFFNVNPAFADDTTCSYFYLELSELPHIKLIQNNDAFKSISDGKWTHGCDIIFKSHDSIVIMPTVFWVDLNKVDFKKASGARKIAIECETSLAGEVYAKFEPAEPFKWLTTE